MSASPALRLLRARGPELSALKAEQAEPRRRFNGGPWRVVKDGVEFARCTTEKKARELAEFLGAEVAQ